MTDQFAAFVPRARQFLSELTQNNTRAWFAANKSTYEAELKRPAMALLEIIAADLARLTAAPVETKLFRPHRDLRFSKDKTPYHTHMHMLWASGGATWFLGIAPDYVSAGAGVFGFEKQALLRWRETVAGADGDVLATLISGIVHKGARLGAPELKRVPAPYDKDHPAADLLRHKGLTLWFDASEDATKNTIEKGGLTTWVNTAFCDLQPLQSALRPLL